MLVLAANSWGKCLEHPSEYSQTCEANKQKTAFTSKSWLGIYLLIITENNAFKMPWATKEKVQRNHNSFFLICF